MTDRYSIKGDGPYFTPEAEAVAFIDMLTRGKSKEEDDDC